MKHIRIIALAALLVGLLLAMLACTGCNTVKGLGRDITCVGQGAQELVD